MPGYTLTAETTLPRASAPEMPSVPSVPSAWAATTQCHSLGSKNDSHVLLEVLEAEESKGKLLAESVTCKCPLPDLRTPHRHMVARDRAMVSACFTRTLFSSCPSDRIYT